MSRGEIQFKRNGLRPLFLGFLARAWGEAAVVFDHMAADTYEGASVFWVRRIAALGGEEAAIADWQLKRDGGKRGIVEVIGHDT